GVHVPHPHLPAVAGGVTLEIEGGVSDDFVDRIGHGTAAAAAIHEKAPDAQLWVIKVFERELATSVPVLVRAIDWATERGIRLVNMSLGTSNRLRAPELGPAIERAFRAGTVIVSAHEHQGTLWYPGALPGVVGVVAEADQPRDELGLVELPRGTAVIASPYPRPIPGVPVEQNLHGISFAVANATGEIARMMESAPEIRTADDVIAVLRSRV
ncbi:MAG: S8 family serine peptidase, partial [Longimicrobiales bacterium]|nr:S8 family serine peptidase [Longimicrobiales bacterium]